MMYQCFSLENWSGAVRISAAFVFLVATQIAAAADSDLDGIDDLADNCILTANGAASSVGGIQVPQQQDVDLDGIGNVCDGDFNQDGLVTTADFTPFLACYTGGTPTADDPTCGESDMNGDGSVNSADFSLFLAHYGDLLNVDTGSGLSCASPSGAYGNCLPCEAVPLCVPGGLLAPQFADCSYVGGVYGDGPEYGECGGPMVLVDSTHETDFYLAPPPNYVPSTISPIRTSLTGFGREIYEDGFPVRDLESLWELDDHANAQILVIAAPQTSLPGGLAGISVPEAATIANWVSQGGGLLVLIDHSPYDSVTNLFDVFGLDFAYQLNGPFDTVGDVEFYRAPASGQSVLVAGNPVADGLAGVGTDDVDLVTTFRGALFRPEPGSAPVGYAPVLQYVEPAGGPGAGSVWDHAAMFEYGSGRVFVAGEIASLTAQVRKNSGLPYGLTTVPEDNVQYLLNMMRWLGGSI